MQQLSFRAMGCQMLALIDAEDGQAAGMLAQVPQWFEQWEQRLSRFRADSELCLLNQAAGQPFQASRTLWTVIDLAIAGAQQSGGLVTPTLLGALEAAGYDHSWDAQLAEGLARTLAHSVGNAAAASQRSPEQWQMIERDKRTRTIRLPKGVRIDLGGVAKGWAAHQAAERLSVYGPALVDAGGDIAVSGPTASSETWRIEVANPFEPEHDLTTLHVGAGGIATSGRDYRRWQRDGQEMHHIIDPRTNQPAQTDVLTATVVAPTTYQAEIAAKTAFLLGSSAGSAWLDERPDFAGLLVLANQQLVYTQRMHAFVG